MIGTYKIESKLITPWLKEKKMNIQALGRKHKIGICG